MNNLLFMIFTTFLVAVVAVIITIVFTKKKAKKRYRNKVNALEVEKNQLVNVKILSEMTKVKELVKTDNLQHKLDNWDKSFSYVKDKMLPKITDDLSDVDFMIDRRDYESAIRKMTNIELEINRLKKRNEKLISEIKLITGSEERNRSLVTKLKIQYRELRSKFDRSIKDYDGVEDAVLERFDSIDNKFQLFENAMDQNDYVEVEKIVIVIDKELNELKNILENIPNIILMANVLIPTKIDDSKVAYSRMIRDGYPLDYLNVEYNLDEISKKSKDIMSKVKTLDVDIDDAELELKTMNDYFNELFSDFDKEKECKDLYREGCKKFRHRIEKVNKVVYDIYVQIDDIKVTYDLTEEEINRFSSLNKNLELINSDFKSLLDHGKSKVFAYSKLNEELEGLSIKLSRLQDDLDFQLRSITSMKDDEYRAKEQLATIQELLKESKGKLRDYKLPVIPSSYYVELKEAQDAIREISKELDKKPIVIKILNIRVDTARDLVFKIYNKTNDMIKAAMKSEDMIVYINRYLSTYPELEQELEKATSMFYKGQYEHSISISKKAIESIENEKKSK
ncbi:MAG: septation ring formation regulator EzrA [Bacilli bacterium]|nr:septation ring formation regulator EzrA [Bacilli bacterium]